MALNAAANVLEKVIGHDTKNLATTSDTSNPGNNTDWADPSGEKMKALVWQGKNSVEVVECPKPRIVDPTDVLVRVTGSTVCGSDMHLLHGVIVQLKAGDILGHEFCGVVEAVGSAVTHLRPGQRVVNSFCISCGQCEFCKQDLTTACERTNASTVHSSMYGSRMAGIFGYSHFVGGFAGGQAEFVRVPFGEQNLLPLPESVPDEKGLYVSDVLCTSYHAVKYTGVNKGDTVAIWGMGPIGLMAAAWAFKEGAARVIGIDNNWRCDYAARKVPGLEPLNYAQLPKGQTVSGKIHEMVPGGVDKSIEASGGEYAKGWAHYFELAAGLENDTSEIVNECISSTKKFGAVGLIADYVGWTNHFNIGSLMERGIRLIGCGQCPVQKYWKEVLAKVESGDIDPTIMLTHRIKLDDIAKGYYKHEKAEDGVVKFFVETRFSQPRHEGTPELTSL